jgi:hypothetical protein
MIIMKSNLKQIIFGFVLLGLTQSCVKESFEGDNIGDKGTTFISAVEDFGDIQYIDAFTNKKDIVGFTLFKNAHNSSELEKETTLTLKINNALIEEYNEEHETAVEVLDPSLYTISNSNFSVSGDNLTVKFPKNSLYEPFKINVDGSKLDLSKTYAFAYDIIDADGYKISDGRESFLVLLGVKNEWDGIYRYQNSPTTSLEPNRDVDVELVTVGPNTVRLYPGLVGYYSNEVRYTVDPVTNKVTVAMTTLLPIATDENSYYDPETKTFHLKWTSNGGARKFEETLTYKAQR